jgi:hypothetical protein
MSISAARQRNTVSEGVALGLVLCERPTIPAETWRVSLAFEDAWRSWNSAYRANFPQVSTDLRKGLNGYLAMTRSDDKKHTFHLFWEQNAGNFVVRARSQWCDGVDPAAVASSLDGNVPASGWQELATNFLERMDPASQDRLLQPESEGTDV